MNKEFILSKIDQSINQLGVKRSIFEQLETNPELILTRLFNREINAPHYDLHIEVFNRNINNIKENSYHDLQEYIANVLIKYLKSLDNDIEVVLVSRSSYPSRLRISYLGEEIIGFDMYKGYFGDFRTLRFKNGLEGELSSNKSLIEGLTKKIAKYESYKNNPKLMFRKELHLKIIDWFTYLRYKRNVYKNLNKKIEQWNGSIVTAERDIQRITANYHEYMDKKDLLEEKVHEWRKRFLEWRFTEKERRSSELY